MDFLQLVSSARTCRRFLQEDGLPEGTLPWLVNCARLVPSAKNAQILRYAIAETPESCAALFPAVRWAGALPDWSGPEPGERPSGYIVMLTAPENKSHLAWIDLGIAAQTIQLAAASRHIGCCIFQTFDPKLIRFVLAISENLEILAILALGMELEERHIVDVPANGSLNYWRDASGVHYVPKRRLEEILLIRK